MKKTLAIFLSIITLAFLAGCTAPTKQTGATQPLKIGILQLVEHIALDDARQGFIKALEDNGFIEGETIQIDYQNAQADSSNLLTMSQRLVNNKSDLILAIATSAAQSVASQTSEIPLLITAVTDPVDAGLVESNELPNTNVTGTNDMSPIKEQLELMLRLAPQTKTVGILYTSSEDNSVLQVKQVKALLEQMNLKIVEQTVTNSNEVQQAAQSLVAKCDAIYTPTDNVIASAMAIISDIAIQSKTPIICAEENQVTAGGLATIGLNYFNLGYQTGEMAVRVLQGANPAEMPIESLVKYDYAINKNTAAALGIEIPQELQEFLR